MATTTATSPQALHPNHNIGQSLAIFDPASPVSPRYSPHSNPASPRTSHPPSPRSRTTRSGASTPVDGPTPASRVDLSTSSYSEDGQLLSPLIPNPELPLILCFRGSGDSCRRSWQSLGKELAQKYRVLLYERTSGQSVPEATSELVVYLKQHDLSGPYVLIAHSHGGAHARCFIDRVGKADVAGAIMVESGQEAVWDSKVQEHQEEHHVLGERPLVVIKGNSLLKKWRQLEDDAAKLRKRAEKGEKVVEAEKARVMLMRNEMERWDKEDTKLKRRQLRLSKKHRFVDIPNVGHHVVRDAPERITEEVDWVMANLKAKGPSAANSADGSKCNSRNASISSSRRTSLDGESGKHGTAVAGDGSHKPSNIMTSWFRKASLALSPSKDRNQDRRRSH